MSAAEPSAATLRARAADRLSSAGAPLLVALCEDAAAGLSQGQAGAKHGLTKNQVAGLAYRNDIKFQGPVHRPVGPMAPAPLAALRKAREAHSQRCAGRYRCCAEAGMSKAQTARYLNVRPAAVSWMAKRHGIMFRPWNAISVKRNSEGSSLAVSNSTAEQHGLHTQQDGETACQRLGGIPTKSEQIPTKSCGAKP